MLRTTRWMGVELWPLAPEQVEHETPRLPRECARQLDAFPG
jgi:hypothetical protein